jgi:hypothetical protein
MSGDFAGAPFGQLEQPIGQRPLKSAEGRAMDCMDDNRHSCSAGGEATDYSGFTTMSVDDVWLLRSKDFLKRPQCLNVFPRPNWPNQLRNYPKGAGLAGKLPLKGTFRAVG